MSLLDVCRRRAANNAWSNFRLHRACARLSQADFEAERTSFFPSLSETLNHIHDKDNAALPTELANTSEI